MSSKEEKNEEDKVRIHGEVRHKNYKDEHEKCPARKEEERENVPVHEEVRHKSRERNKGTGVPEAQHKHKMCMTTKKAQVAQKRQEEGAEIMHKLCKYQAVRRKLRKKERGNEGSLKRSTSTRCA